MLFAFVCFVCAAVHTTQEPAVVIPKVCIKLEVCLAEKQYIFQDLMTRLTSQVYILVFWKDC